MKKIIILIILLIGLSVQAVVIKGGVHYTVESAREEAFSKVRYTIPMDEHKKYLTDPGFSLDKNGKPKIRKFGRRVTFFSNGNYGVYYSSKQIGYFYYNDGTLNEISYLIGYKYPKLTIKYDTSGNLTCVIYEAAPRESYVYDANKNFLGRWVNEEFFDPHGNLLLLRKY